MTHCRDCKHWNKGWIGLDDQPHMCILLSRSKYIVIREDSTGDTAAFIRTPPGFSCNLGARRISADLPSGHSG